MSGGKFLKYGEYPQTVVREELSKSLERTFGIGSLIQTGKKYTTDSKRYDEYNEKFTPKQNIEYEYSGNRYVRIIANLQTENTVLSNGQTVNTGDAVWVKVEDIEWEDKGDGKILARKGLFAGIQFDEKNTYDGNFAKTNIKKYLDNYFEKEILPSREVIKSQNSGTENTRRKNPYDLTFENVKEEDIMKGAVESGVSVFLHGRSSEGKSARVKQLDPDCEIIYLRNATPESLNGKSVYDSNSGEIIDVKPTWLKKIEKKCENEPEKIHIVFLDEITNSLPSMQGMAFNIVLDREVNGIWKLPDNCRVVAAGNDMNDSLAANQLAEPLFNRFAHVYIETTVDDWLEWARTADRKYEKINYEPKKTESKIHPAIYAFIAYRREDVLRTEYNGERPNADPRKWEMASKILYRTKNPKMLKALIGEDMTQEFSEFCNRQVITLQDVIDDKYSEENLKMDIAEKHITVSSLSFVDDKNMEKVRKFVSKLGREQLAVFDNFWTGNDEKRMEKIAELRAEENLLEGRESK